MKWFNFFHLTPPCASRKRHISFLSSALLVCLSKSSSYCPVFSMLFLAGFHLILSCALLIYSYLAVAAKTILSTYAMTYMDVLANIVQAIGYMRMSRQNQKHKMSIFSKTQDLGHDNHQERTQQKSSTQIFVVVLLSFLGWVFMLGCCCCYCC